MGLQPDYKSLLESEIKFCTGPLLMNEKKKGNRQQEHHLMKILIET